MASIIFFGSFQEYSASTLATLAQSAEVKAVVTTPPAPVGRKQILTENQVEITGRELSVPVFTPSILDEQFRETLKQLETDFFVVAGYRLLLPPSYLETPRYASINIHYSLLPAFRGAMPAEWAILLQAEQTGVTLIEMSPQFDTGKIISHRTLPINANHTRVDLYQSLYPLGASLFLDSLEDMTRFYRDHKPSDSLILPPTPQPPSSPTPYARKLSKADTYIPLAALEAAINGKTVLLQDDTLLTYLTKRNLPDSRTARLIHDIIRASYPWPGGWTTIDNESGPKRILLHQSRLNGDKLEIISSQKEGKIPQPGLAI